MTGKRQMQKYCMRAKRSFLKSYNSLHQGPSTSSSIRSSNMNRNNFSQNIDSSPNIDESNFISSDSADSFDNEIPGQNLQPEESIETQNDFQPEIEPQKKRKRKQETFSPCSDVSDKSFDEESLSLTPPKIKESTQRVTSSNNNNKRQKNETTEAKNTSPIECGTIENENAMTCKKCQENDKYLKSVVKQNHLIRALLTELLDEVKEIKEKLKFEPKKEPKESFFYKYPELQFPINCEEDIVMLEAILQNNEDFQDAVEELSKLGGKNVYEFVKRVLTHIITDNVAVQYSWLGRQGKKQFYSLKLATLVIYAAERAKMTENRRDTEISIQLWLKRAVDRKTLVKSF